MADEDMMDEDDSDDAMEEKEAAAEDLIQAVADKEPSDLVDAFTALYELCRKG